MGFMLRFIKINEVLKKVHGNHKLTKMDDMSEEEVDQKK